jgi:hypothetical protein
VTKLICALLLSSAYAGAQRVEGTVVDSFTGDGIPGVNVEIVASNSQGIYSAVTDTQGRFRIDGVQDGFYGVRYRAAGYQDVAFMPQLNPAPPPRFQVKAPSDPVKLQARMIHFGRMSGRLVDDKGNGVPHAMMDMSEGILGMGTDTDAEGKFTLPIFPGVAHTLMVIPQAGWKPPDPEPGTGRVLGWARTYYPGVATREAAMKIILPPGGELRDVELKLVALPVHAVRGVLVNPDGSPAAKVAITLGQEPRTPALKTESRADGTFEFPAVVDGAWRFAAEVERDGVKYRAAQWIEVSGRDVEGVRLRLDAPFTVRVRSVMETREGWTAPKPPVPRLMRVGIGPGPDMEPFLPARSEPDGSARIEPVYPGVYRFESLLMAVPAGYYLDEVRLGDSVLTAPDVELSSGALPLTLVYKINGGTVRGTVEKCASGGVVLAPQDPALRWPMAIHIARCDASDRYEIPAVRPGEYYTQAFAIDPTKQIWQPEFDENRISQSTKITVRAGEATAADLRLIPR